jgi:AraC-like DNA-binding protein
MHILALLTPLTRNLVENAVRGQQATLGAVTELFGRTGTAWEPDVFAIDPEFAALPPIADALLQYAPRHPYVGITLLGELAPPFVQLVAQLGRHRVITVGLRPYDAAQSVWTYLRQAYLGVFPDRVVRELAGELAQLPEPSAVALRRLLLEQPLTVRTLDDFAAYAGLEKRTLQRHLTKAGFQSPKGIVRAARLLRGFHRFYERTPLPEIAEGLGYRRYWDFQRHTQQLFGANPRTLRYHTDPAELPGRVAAALRGQLDP